MFQDHTGGSTAGTISAYLGDLTNRLEIDQHFTHHDSLCLLIIPTNRLEIFNLINISFMLVFA